MSRSALWLALPPAVAACIAPPAAKPAVPAPVAPAAASPAASLHCAWPGGAKAAVSLTYDDALPSQVQFAAPALAQRELKATFFLSGSRIAELSELAKAGHELGVHTITHPCNADLARLTLDEMASVLDGGRAAVGGEGQLTFAYPCGQMQVAGGASYVPLVKERFSAARGVAAAVAEPGSVDLFNVPALFPPTSSDGSDALALVERAQASGGWVVLGFHGVTEQGEYLQITRAAHERILSYLAEHRAEVWTAPFGEVARAVAACRQENAQ